MGESHRYGVWEHILFPPTRRNSHKLARHLNGKTVLITGASFGIGEQVALALADTGARLILVGRTTDKLRQVRDSVVDMGGEATMIPADLTNSDDLLRLFEVLDALENGIDIVISNAGRSLRRSIEDSLDRYHDVTRTMAINFQAPVQLALHLIPVLRSRQGHFLHVSGVNVLLAPPPRWAAYQASKAAFDQWFRSTSPELAASGIATSSIYLPLVKTRMIEPTETYRNMPAMSPQHAARIICRQILSRSRAFKPWWTIFGELGSVLFRTIWESILARDIKKTHAKHS